MIAIQSYDKQFAYLPMLTPSCLIQDINLVSFLYCQCLPFGSFLNRLILLICILIIILAYTLLEPPSNFSVLLLEEKSAFLSLTLFSCFIINLLQLQFFSATSSDLFFSSQHKFYLANSSTQFIAIIMLDLTEIKVFSLS